MAPHSSTLAWKIPWTEEPGRLKSMGSRRVGHNWATSLSCIGKGNGNPLQCSCLETPRDREAWWAAVYGVTQSWTQLKWLSSSCLYHVFLDSTWGMSHDVSASLFDLFHSIWQSLGPSMLLQITLFHSFNVLILHCIYVPHLLYPFLCLWPFRLLPYLGCCK